MTCAVSSDRVPHIATRDHGVTATSPALFTSKDRKERSSQPHGSAACTTSPRLPHAIALGLVLLTRLPFLGRYTSAARQSRYVREPAARSRRAKTVLPRARIEFRSSRMYLVVLAGVLVPVCVCVCVCVSWYRLHRFWAQSCYSRPCEAPGRVDGHVLTVWVMSGVHVCSSRWSEMLSARTREFDCGSPGGGR